MSACRFGCCDAEAASLPDGGWKSTEKGWAIDERRAEHLRREWAALSARIDKNHADYPKCPCGQRTLALDKFGLCSKTTEEHQRRRGIYAAPKTRARA